MVLPVPASGTYLGTLASYPNNPHSRKTLEAIDRTLEFFGIDHQRTLVAESVLRVSYLVLDQPLFPKDSKTKLLLTMCNYFEKELTE